MAFEGIVLSGLNVNDGASFEAESLVFTPAQPLAQWASNPDSDGQVLVEEPHYGPAYFEFTLRVIPQSTMDAALTKLGELNDALSSCKRLEDGAPLEWTPAGTSTTYTWYARLAEHTEFPTTAEGDTAGWFIKSPVVKVKLTCDPAGETEEKVVKAATVSGAEPLQVVYAKVGGDLDAKARAIITDKATQDRRHLEIGRQVVESEAQPTAIILAAALTTTGFSGALKTRSGAYSEEKVIRATAVSSPTVMCGTGNIEHIGPYRVKARVYATSENARFRISYKNGDGPWVPLEFVEAPVVNEWAEIDLGEVTFDEAVLGAQGSQIRFESKSIGAKCENDLNYLPLMPSTGFVKLRGTSSDLASKLEAYDEFEQTAGALSGKEMPLPSGAKWSGAGDEADFSVVAEGGIGPSGGHIKRTATSDADLNTGRYAIAGTAEYTTVQVSALATTSGVLESGKLRAGVFARYASTSSWVAAVLTAEGGISREIKLSVYKRVAGTVTTLGTYRVATGTSFALKVALQVASDGTWRAWAVGQSAVSLGTPQLSGQDSTLATGGALATGKVGIYDAWTSSSALTRLYDSFNVLAAEPAGRVCYSGKQVQWRHDGALRQDSTGTYDGPPSIARGANFYLAPEGSSGRINRLVIAMRRNDVDVEPAPNVTDKHSVEILATERFLTPR